MDWLGRRAEGVRDEMGDGGVEGGGGVDGEEEDKERYGTSRKSATS